MPHVGAEGFRVDAGGDHEGGMGVAVLVKERIGSSPASSQASRALSISTGSYIDEITPEGKLVWDIQLLLEYPSDLPQLGPNRYPVADYAKPGGIYEFNRAARSSGPTAPRAGPACSIIPASPSGFRTD
jgi:hypothetical protein